MPMYLTQVKYLASGVQGLIKEGAAARATNVSRMIEQAGGKVHVFYFALGETDVFVISEYADRSGALALSIAVNASGAVTVTQTELIAPAEIDGALKKMPAYRAPGA